MTLNLSLLLTSLAVSAGAPKQVALTKVTERIYVVEDGFYHPENSAVYIGDKDVTVISATWTPETAQLLAQELRKITGKPITAVVNTHFHLDRAGGNPYFRKIGAKIIASNRTAALMKSKWASSLESAKKDYPGYPSIPFTPPDVTFDDQYDLEDGKIQVRYFGPSHTEDDAVVYFPDEQILFGDCVLKEKLGWLGDANVAEYPRTLERIKKLKIKTIIAGHWSPLHGPELIDQMLQQLKERESTACRIPTQSGPDYFNEGLARYVDANGKFGFMDTRLRIVIPAAYDFAFPFEGGKARVCNGCQEAHDEGREHATRRGGTWATIDRKGRKIE